MYGQQWSGEGAWGHGMFASGAPDWAIFAFAFLGPLIVLIVLWSVVWKGLALWHSARRGEPWWFVIMLVVNTLGILEIIYLFGVAKLHWKQLFSSHDGHHSH
ncbi:MAG: DUF5652 family protein [Patescibacteria group bacterium]